MAAERRGVGRDDRPQGLEVGGSGKIGCEEGSFRGGQASDAGRRDHIWIRKARGGLHSSSRSCGCELSDVAKSIRDPWRT